MDLSSHLEIVRLSDVGLRRDHNEDAVAGDVANGLLVLADGMGGYLAGEVASATAVLAIVTELREKLLDVEPGHVNPLTGLQRESLLIEQAVAKANADVYHASTTRPQCAGMGTTLVLALFTNNRVLVGHIGDSRMYRIRGEVLQRLTRDHSVLQEQLDAGLISADEAKCSNYRNLVTRALGIEPTVELELNEFDVSLGDIYLLCSDGLTDLLEDSDIYSIIYASRENLELAASRLVEMANERGGTDNISVILARTLALFPAQPASWPQRMLRWLT